MAQAPATSKSKRAALRLSAAFGGAGLARRLSPGPSERAALDLREVPAGQAEASEVRFLIPLVGPHHVSDWDAVTARLQATLSGFLAQADPRWRAIICCQTRPPLPADPRISHLPFEDPTPGNDKWRKLAALCDHLPRVASGPGYSMSFDADDLPHRGLVGEMLRRQARGGYLVEAGYVMDHATGDIALADAPSLAQPLRKPFWKLCGSCCALCHDPGDTRANAFLRAMTAHEHRMFPYLAALAGRRLTPLQDASVLYVLNHGENFGARRGRVGFKTRFVQRFKLGDATRLAQIAQDFPRP